MAGYKAFISYNHAVDGRLAPMLQSGVRRIGKPWYRLPFRVFRDKTSLNPPILWKAIERALESSEYFLLLACPESAGSSWVDEEIRWWLKNRPLDRLIIVLTGGEIVWDRAAGDFDWTRTSALGVCLRGRFNQEPLHVDLRWARTEQRSSLTQSRFRQAILVIERVAWRAA